MDGLAKSDKLGKIGLNRMKIGFSSMVCPGWDLEKIVITASELGFDGIEIRGLRGQLHLPLVPELAGQPEKVGKLLEDHKVELVCLSASATLDAKDKSTLVEAKAEISDCMELAQKLGCPFVKIFIGEVQRRDNQRACLSRIARELATLTPIAVRFNVTLLVENGGDFPGSGDLWFLMDAVDHPSVRCCWNQCYARTARERVTNSIPRLGNRIGMVHVCDARFDEQGVLSKYVSLGEGDVEIPHLIDVLRGLVYDRYLMFEWPKLWVDTLPSPETALPAVAEFLRKRLEHRQPILSAYKGDKNAPRLATRESSAAND